MNYLNEKLDAEIRNFEDLKKNPARQPITLGKYIKSSD